MSFEFKDALGGDYGVSQEGDPLGMEILQIGIHSCACLAVSCVTPLTTSLEDY